MQNRYFEITEQRIFKLSCYLSCWFHVFLGESHHKGILIRHFSFTTYLQAEWQETINALMNKLSIKVYPSIWLP